MIRAALFLLLAITIAGVSRAADQSAELMAAMNYARTQPQAFARLVAERGPSLTRNSRAVAEAVRFLEKQRPLPALSHSPGLTQAALTHVIDSGARGLRGHRGSDGSNVSKRASRFGRWDVRIGENIFYGRVSARDAIIALIIDDGVRDRYHRRNIFERQFRYAGAAAGYHASYGMMMVTDFAAEFRESTGSRMAGLQSQTDRVVD